MTRNEWRATNILKRLRREIEKVSLDLPMRSPQVQAQIILTYAISHLQGSKLQGNSVQRYIDRYESL